VKRVTFVDTVLVHVAAGDGGNGCSSFRREKFVPKGGPDGGDGGRGGHVILRADRNTDSLIGLFYAPHLRAPHGGHGLGKQMHGRDGKDCVARVPCGTVIRRAEDDSPLGEIVEHGAEFIVARGGKGGLGNCHWKTPSHQAPTEKTPGAKGEILELRLELKLVADVGLVGLPNAGKSSLLARLTHAHPKIGPYPFTTIHPVIGTLVFEDYAALRLADIPGLIEGAHAGAGLGHLFLRHVERTSSLVFVLDMASVEGRDPAQDYDCLRREISLYKADLLDRRSLVVANKMDLPEAKEKLAAFVRETGVTPLPVSTITGEGLDELRRLLHEWAPSPSMGTGPATAVTPSRP
jgi:GTP-binding protein